MSETMAKAYSEVYTILNFIDQYYVNKISEKFIEFIYNQKDDNYIPNIDMSIPLEEQELLEDTINILAIIQYNYWCENEKEKQELIAILNKNEEKYQQKLSEKFSTDKIFQKNTTEIESNEMVVYKENFIQRIINKLKKWFKI